MLIGSAICDEAAKPIGNFGILEAAGIRTVAITDEYAGADGASQSLADATPQADALVSTGNANERIVLPPMDKLLGPLPDVARLAGGYAQSLRTA